MSLTKLSLAGNNLANRSPRKVWSKEIQESRKSFLQCTVYVSVLSAPNWTERKPVGVWVGFCCNAKFAQKMGNIEQELICKHSIHESLALSEKWVQKF